MVCRAHISRIEIYNRDIVTKCVGDIKLLGSSMICDTIRSISDRDSIDDCVGSRINNRDIIRTHIGDISMRANIDHLIGICPYRDTTNTTSDTDVFEITQVSWGIVGEVG
jgi:hypothetical protein